MVVKKSTEPVVVEKCNKKMSKKKVEQVKEVKEVKHDYKKIYQYWL
tara:strand:+ start:780 stop:917 length:138 start_codon:yes stop_codon:yes gene_type:complete